MESNDTLIRCTFRSCDNTISDTLIFCLLTNLDSLGKENPNEKNAATLYNESDWVWLFYAKSNSTFEFKLTQCNKNDFGIAKTEDLINYHQLNVPTISSDQAVSMELRWNREFNYDIISVDEILNENEDLFERLTLSEETGDNDNEIVEQKDNDTEFLKCEENESEANKISPKIKFKINTESLDSICGSSSEIEEIMSHQPNKLETSALSKNNSSEIPSSSSDKKSSENVSKVNELPEEDEVFTLMETEDGLVDIDRYLLENCNSTETQNIQTIKTTPLSPEPEKSRSHVIITKIQALLGFGSLRPKYYDERLRKENKKTEDGEHSIENNALNNDSNIEQLLENNEKELLTDQTDDFSKTDSQEPMEKSKFENNFTENKPLIDNQNIELNIEFSSKSLRADLNDQSESIENKNNESNIMTFEEPKDDMTMDLSIQKKNEISTEEHKIIQSPATESDTINNINISKQSNISICDILPAVETSDSLTNEKYESLINIINKNIENDQDLSIQKQLENENLNRKFYIESKRQIDDASNKEQMISELERIENKSETVTNDSNREIEINDSINNSKYESDINFENKSNVEVQDFPIGKKTESEKVVENVPISLQNEKTDDLSKEEQTLKERKSSDSMIPNDSNKFLETSCLNIKENKNQLKIENISTKNDKDLSNEEQLPNQVFAGDDAKENSQQNNLNCDENLRRNSQNHLNQDNILISEEKKELIDNKSNSMLLSDDYNKVIDANENLNDEESRSENIQNDQYLLKRKQLSYENIVEILSIKTETGSEKISNLVEPTEHKSKTTLFTKDFHKVIKTNENFNNEKNGDDLYLEDKNFGKNINLSNFKKAGNENDEENVMIAETQKESFPIVEQMPKERSDTIDCNTFSETNDMINNKTIKIKLKLEDENTEKDLDCFNRKSFENDKASDNVYFVTENQNMYPSNEVDPTENKSDTLNIINDNNDANNLNNKKYRDEYKINNQNLDGSEGFLSDRKSTNEIFEGDEVKENILQNDLNQNSQYQEKDSINEEQMLLNKLIKTSVSDDSNEVIDTVNNKNNEFNIEDNPAGKGRNLLHLNKINNENFEENSPISGENQYSSQSDKEQKILELELNENKSENVNITDYFNEKIETRDNLNHSKYQRELKFEDKGFGKGEDVTDILFAIENENNALPKEEQMMKEKTSSIVSITDDNDNHIETSDSANNNKSLSEFKMKDEITKKDERSNRENMINQIFEEDDVRGNIPNNLNSNENLQSRSRNQHDQRINEELIVIDNELTDKKSNTTIKTNKNLNDKEYQNRNIDNDEDVFEQKNLAIENTEENVLVKTEEENDELLNKEQMIKEKRLRNTLTADNFSDMIETSDILSEEEYQNKSNRNDVSFEDNTRKEDQYSYSNFNKDLRSAYSSENDQNNLSNNKDAFNEKDVYLSTLVNINTNFKECSDSHQPETNRNICEINQRELLEKIEESKWIDQFPKEQSSETNSNETTTAINQSNNLIELVDNKSEITATNVKDESNERKSKYNKIIQLNTNIESSDQHESIDDQGNSIRQTITNSTYLQRNSYQNKPTESTAITNRFQKPQIKENEIILVEFTKDKNLNYNNNIDNTTFESKPIIEKCFLTDEISFINRDIVKENDNYLMNENLKSNSSQCANKISREREKNIFSEKNALLLDVESNESSLVTSLSKESLDEIISTDNLYEKCVGMPALDTCSNAYIPDPTIDVSIVISPHTSSRQSTNQIEDNKSNETRQPTEIENLYLIDRLEYQGCREIQSANAQSDNEMTTNENGDVCFTYDNNQRYDTHLSTGNNPDVIDNFDSDNDSNNSSVNASLCQPKEEEQQQLQLTVGTRNSRFHDQELENRPMVNSMICLILNKDTNPLPTTDEPNYDLISMQPTKHCPNNDNYLSVETSISSNHDSAVICDSDLNSDSQSVVETIVQDDFFDEFIYNHPMTTSQTIDSLFVSALSSNKLTPLRDNVMCFSSKDNSHEVLFDDTQLSLTSQDESISKPQRPTEYCSLPIPPRSGMKRSPALEGVCDLLKKTDSELKLIQKSYIMVNDDNLYPDAITPTKADSNLRIEGCFYDIPYIDDEAFYNDSISSPVGNRDHPLGRLADCDECTLASTFNLAISVESVHKPPKQPILPITKKKRKTRSNFFCCGCLSKNRK